MVRVDDGNSGSATQNFSIDVTPGEEPNVAPTIDSSPVLTGTVGQLYSYDVEASDGNGDILTYSLDIPANGMTIDGSTGLIQWTPGSTQTGSSYVKVRVEDGNGGADTQSFFINVAASSNAAPTIDSTAPLTATVDELYTYDVSASDADGDPLTFALTQSPAGMSITSSTGLIQWTPGVSQEGSHPVTVSVDDGNSGTDTQSFTVVVSSVPPANAAPTIDSTAPLTATVDELYTYDVSASDADGDPLTFALTQSPAGMSITSSTGLIQWTPGVSQEGSHPVTVSVDDGNSGTDTQSFTVVVSSVPPANSAPTIDSTAPLTATVDELYIYDVDASDIDGDPLTYSLTSSPTGMSIDSSTGLIQWTPSSLQQGTVFVTVRVEDDQSAADTQSFVIDVDPAISSSIVHVGDMDGIAISAGRDWSAEVTIQLHGAGETQPAGTYTISGTWSNGISGQTSCVATNGSCTLSTDLIPKKGNASVRFTLASVVGDGTFQSGSNHDPDGDSNGIWITVTR